MSFKQFLVEREKMVKLFGLNTGRTSNKLITPINPAKPARPVYSGLNVAKINPILKLGTPKSGIIGR